MHCFVGLLLADAEYAPPHHLRQVQPLATPAGVRQTRGVTVQKTSQAVALGVVAVLFLNLFTVLWKDATASVPVPVPHQYGEGVMVWMARELDAGRSPYGDILAAPSRYSCYGPLPSALAALISRVVPSDDGMRYVIAGRILNLALWMIAGFSLGLLSGRIPVGFAMAVALPLAISHISFMWTFRVDSAVAAVESVILLVLARHRPLELRWALPVLLSCLALTKPPAAVDLVPLSLLALAFSSEKPLRFARSVLPHLLTSGALALAVFFALDWVQGGWMSNNILWEQKRSGWNPGVSVGYNVGNFMLKTPMWPILLWCAWGVASSLSRNARYGLVGLAVSLAACGAASMKYGADVNYYVPALVLMAALAVMRMTSYGQTAVFLVAIHLAATPLIPWDGMPALHRAVWNYASSQRANADYLISAHSADTVLSEDPFFSVLAGHHPLVTDVFQYNIAAHRSGKVPSDLLSLATAAWGGSRLRDLLANWGSMRTTFAPVSAGVPYMPEAFLLSPATGLTVSSPPYLAKHPPPLWEYFRRSLAPATVLFLAGIFWGRPFRPRRAKTALPLV